MKCPKNKACPKQPSTNGIQFIDLRPRCTKCDRPAKDKKPDMNENKKISKLFCVPITMKQLSNVPSKGIKLTDAEIRSSTVSGGLRSLNQLKSIRKKIKAKKENEKNEFKFRSAKKIELAATDNTGKYQKEIDVVLKLLGHSEALVTDESSVWDFLSHFGDEKENQKLNEKTLDKISGRLGLLVQPRDLLVDIAKKIRK
jgi:hypothetical protein